MENDKTTTTVTDRQLRRRRAKARTVAADELMDKAVSVNPELRGLSDIRPWERRPDESELEFEAFRIFRDLPPGNRTFRAVSEILYPGAEWARGKIRGWFDKFEWDHRVELMQRYNDRVFLEAQQETIRDVASRHISYAKKLQEVGFKALGKLLDENGNPRPDLSASDIRLLIVEGAKLERNSRGMVGSGVDKGDGLGLGELSTEELREMGKLARRLASGAEPPKSD